MRYLALVMLLSGCMSIEDRRQLMMENAGKNCDDMGFKRGTERHSECQLDLIRAVAGGNASRPVAVPVK